ncbi:MAG TPA: PepSY domain-containing protein [Aquaticitalea sp.]|nr:PepSY domain-containing protein [Aquaticitalea sp.]
MTISIWRYSHLALAISSFVFIFLASVTGIILAFEPISEQIRPYKTEGFNSVTLAETIDAFKSNYPEVISLEVDSNQFVSALAITTEGESLNGYFNPITAEYLDKKIEPSLFFQWVTNFHRSLFLKGTGRFFVGLCSFLLFLIAFTGSVLIIKRQRSFKRFFSRIVNDNFAQYWHVVLGRLSLIPIIIITLTGVYLSLEKFDVLPESVNRHQIDFDHLSQTPKLAVSEIPVFRDTKLSEVLSVEFPFSELVDDYYTIKLKDREIVVNQFNGEILSEMEDSLLTKFSNLSLTLHTGKGSILWSIVLAVASANILFFIYSGFAMTLKRRRAKLKNKHKKNTCEYVILVGSENGGTLPFANALQQQLLALGKRVYIAELNKYSKFKKAEHLVVMTSTYGEGEAPTNANKFLQRLEHIEQKHDFSFSVVGFGSLAYPDFCKFAFDVDAAFLRQNRAQLLPPFTINDKSFESFEQWAQLWSEKVGLDLTIPKENLVSRPKHTKCFEIVSKTKVEDNPDNTFLMTLKPKQSTHFNSGDLLSVYPKNDYRERLYSIGKVNGNIQLSVKYYENGLGSTYLNNFKVGDTFKARLIENAHFHLPTKASKIIMISNGTGVAPFLGMLHGNKKHIVAEMYFGIRTEQSFQLYQSQLNRLLKSKNLTKLNVAFSQQNEKVYVQDLLERDGESIAKGLEQKAVIMICGSLAMYKDVMETLNTICMKYNDKPLSAYSKQIKSDCY